LIGSIISADEVKARWAYGEMTSTRWGPHFVGKHQALVQKAIAKVPFSTLSPQEHQELIQALPLARNPAFISSIDQSSRYQWQHWTKGQLCQTYALAAFNPPLKNQAIPYYDFFVRFPDTGPNGLPEDSDPRVVFAKNSIQFDPDHEPAIFVGAPGHYVLIEGALRSVIFMHSPGNGFRLNALVPHA
jgi:hypothetical protein